jgi:hypothetical protein
VADWATISSLATAGGTLVLAVATFAAVRSGNRSAAVTERMLLASMRPVLAPSRFEDPVEKVGFMDEVWLKVPGGGGAVQVTDDAIYLAIALRNVGTGLAVLDRWDIQERRVGSDGSPASADHRPVESFRRLTRDLYVPTGDTGFWQGALRDKADPDFAMVANAVAERHPITIDMLYGDHEGGQRTITRFGLIWRPEAERYVAAVSRHWNLDRSDPR